MSVRLITSLLALAILWSGFSSWEWGAVADEAAVVVVAVPGSPLDDGSVADHHLDDQPVQSPSDLLALVQQHGLGTPSVRLGGNPHCGTDAVPDTPFLEGLRRPPRLAA